MTTQNRFNSVLTLIAVIAATLAFAGTAAAELINVNFETFTPTILPFETESTLSGPAGGLNTQWNQYADEDSSGVVVDSTGAPTAVTFTTDFNEGRRGENANVLPMLNSTLTYFPRTLQTRNLTIDGLEAGSLHDVWIVAYRDQNPFNNGQERLSGTWSTTNATTSASSQLLDSSTTQSDLAFTDGVNFIKFANVQADGAGTIVFDAVSSFRLGADPNDGDPNDYHRLGLSGFQIQSVAPAVPEPATFGLAALGLLSLGFAGWRRRRR